MPSGTRQCGEFCWINMLTPHPAAARAFFARLFAWTYEEIPGLGHTMQVGGRDIGGLFDLDAPTTPKGTPPTLGVMVKVDSADAAAARVTALGGRARPAFDILQNGRMAVCFDAAGAEFDAWEPRLQPGTDVDSSLHGAPGWFELMTTDVARAARFYGELFGWKARAVPGSGYTVLALGDHDITGMQAITGRMGKMPSHWVTYFTVTDADATARLAVELGAQIDMQPHAASGVRFCGLTSPHGVHFRVVAQVR